MGASEKDGLDDDGTESMTVTSGFELCLTPRAHHRVPTYLARTPGSSRDSDRDQPETECEI